MDEIIEKCQKNRMAKDKEPLDEIRSLIVETAKLRRLTLKEISLRLGKNHAYMHQFIHKKSPPKLGGDDRAILSMILQIPEKDLGAPISPNINLEKLPTIKSNAIVTGDRQQKGPGIPLYGTVVGGIDGQFELNGNVLDIITAPPSLFGIKDAYAVRIAGESMEPRYEDGETVFVNPQRRPTKNDYVVAQIRNEEGGAPLAYVKKFVRWNSEKLVLSQLNPEKTLEFDAKNVVSVHYILRSGE